MTPVYAWACLWCALLVVRDTVWPKGVGVTLFVGLLAAGLLGVGR